MGILTSSIHSLRQVGTWLAPIFFALTWAEMLLQKWIQEALGSHEGAPPWIWALVIVAVLLSLATPLITAIFVLSSNLSHTWKQDLNLLFIEQFRAMGQVLLWSLLLIVPGLIRLAQLSLVPFVVLLDPKYKAGQLDALKTSTRVFKAHWLRIGFWILLFGAIAPLLMTMADPWVELDGWFFKYWWWGFANIGAELVLAVIFTHILKAIYLKESNGTYV